MSKRSTTDELIRALQVLGPKPRAIIAGARWQIEHDRLQRALDRSALREVERA